MLIIVAVCAPVVLVVINAGPALVLLLWHCCCFCLCFFHTPSCGTLALSSFQKGNPARILQLLLPQFRNCPAKLRATHRPASSQSVRPSSSRVLYQRLPW